MNSELRGKRRGGSGEDVDINATLQGDLISSPHLPKYALASATGDLVRVDCTTAVATVQAIPTTTAMLTVWNGDSSKSYVIDQLFADVWSSHGNNLGRLTIMASLHPVGMGQPDTQDLTPIKLNANGNYGGNAWCDVGFTVVNDAWRSWAGINLNGADDDADPGNIAIADIDGRMVLPPRAGLSIAAISGSSAWTVKMGMSWYEVQLDLG